jgi:transposase, IS30 family
MKRYTHLTENERYQIKSLISLGHGVAKTAEHLKRSDSTIKRELKRNRGGRGYRPRQAHALAAARLHERARDNARRIEQSTWDRVEEALQFQYSPEQISGRLKLDGEAGVSHEAIYRYVYADKSAGGTLWCHLRCQKRRRVRYGSGHKRRGVIANRVSIDQRPAIVRYPQESSRPLGGRHHYRLRPEPSHCQPDRAPLALHRLGESRAQER